MASKQVILDFVAACDAALEGGAADPWAFLDENVTVRVNGTTPISGVFPGIGVVRSILLDTVKRRLRKASVSVAEFVGTGSRVAALLRVRAETCEGKLYNEAGETCGCLFEVRQDRIVELFLFPDTTQVETVLFNRRYVPNGG